MDSYDGTPQTLVEYTRKLVMQFLYEQNYNKTLEALEEETGVKYENDTMPLASELLDAVREHIEFVEAAKNYSKNQSEPSLLKVSLGFIS